MMKKRVDGKDSYILEEPEDGLLDCLKLTDRGTFPYIHLLLCVGCISPIGSSEAERVASGVRWIKTPYRSTMTDIRENNREFSCVTSYLFSNCGGIRVSDDSYGVAYR